MKKKDLKSRLFKLKVLIPVCAYPTWCKNKNVFVIVQQHHNKAYFTDKTTYM